MGHEAFDRDTPVHGSSNRSLGVVFATVFLIIGVLPLVFGGTPRWWSLAIAAVFVVLAFLVPKVLGPLNRLWTRFGLLLHRIVSPVVLGIMFFLVVTPTGLIMRALGKDPLRLRLDPNARSYWMDRTPPGPPPQTLPDQF